MSSFIILVGYPFWFGILRLGTLHITRMECNRGNRREAIEKEKQGGGDVCLKPTSLVALSARRR